MGEMTVDEPKSAIKHEGNFFIMDSEALVCNPFQDMQTEVMTEAQKKASLTEKLTSVKNNVCENHFFMEKAQLEREKTGTLKKLHDHSSKLRYEVKLLDLDRQRHKIEVKKRVLPDRDYSYDEQQISNTEKRLGANICSYYLERKMKYPMRLKSVSDISTTPLVRKARQALKTHDTDRAVTAMHDPTPNKERAHTANTVSSQATTASPVRPIKLLNRRDSRSAPLVSRSCAGPSNTTTTITQRDEATRLPAISDDDALPRTGLRNGLTVHKSLGRVKFMFEDPLKFLATKDKDSESASLLSRPYTYHPGMGDGHRNNRDLFLDDSDDDGDPNLPDHIDLRALLFDRDGHRGDEAVSNKSIAHGNHVPTPILRRSNSYAPRVTQDLIQQENEIVQSKVNKFIQELAENVPRHSDSDSDLEDDIFTMPMTAPKGVGGTTAVSLINTTKPSQSTDDASPQDTTRERRNKVEENKTPRIPKDTWKHIRGRSMDGSLRGRYSAEDLVMQTLTGVPLNHSLTAGIPLHSASRAMRHTATFKMRKVLERLINERTKFQQHEIDEIKRKMEEGMDIHTAAASLNTANPTPGLGPPGFPARVDSFSRSSTLLERTDSISGDSDSMPISQGVNG